jgi:prepilin-type N-terminal cleavage/methylation domain-containing protein
MKKGFTLIELLVVIAVIGTLSTIIVSSLASARERAQIAAIQQTLKGIQTNALIYQLDEGTFEGLCTFSDESFHPSIETQIEGLKDIAGEDRVHCIVRTSDVPFGGAHFVANDNLARKNFSVAVSFADRNFGVDIDGIFELDKEPRPSSNVDWDTANQICTDQGKKLPPIEFLTALYYNGTGWYNGDIREFTLGTFWTSNVSSNGQVYTAIIGSYQAIRLRPKGYTVSAYRCIS